MNLYQGGVLCQWHFWFDTRLPKIRLNMSWKASLGNPYGKYPRKSKSKVALSYPSAGLQIISICPTNEYSSCDIKYYVKIVSEAQILFSKSDLSVQQKWWLRKTVKWGKKKKKKKLEKKCYLDNKHKHRKKNITDSAPFMVWYAEDKELNLFCGPDKISKLHSLAGIYIQCSLYRQWEGRHVSTFRLCIKGFWCTINL